MERGEDLEITIACAKVMGNDAWTDINGRWYCSVRGREAIFDPLHDDAQAMALVKKFHLHVYHFHTWHAGAAININRKPTAREAVVTDEDLNRAVCQCVAQMSKTDISASPLQMQSSQP